MSEAIITETTEDQRRAAASFCLPVDSAGNPPSYTDHWVKTGDPGVFRCAGAGPVVLACLFAEREAKLREEVKERYDDFMGALKGWKDAESENDELRAEAKTLRAVDERKSCMLCDRDVIIDQLRAEIVGLKRTISMDYDWAVWMLDQEDKLIARVRGLHERCLRLDGGAGFDGACVECVGVDEVPEHLRDFRCWKHTPLPTPAVLPTPRVDDVVASSK